MAPVIVTHQPWPAICPGHPKPLCPLILPFECRNGEDSLSAVYLKCSRQQSMLLYFVRSGLQVIAREFASGLYQLLTGKMWVIFYFSVAFNHLLMVLFHISMVTSMWLHGKQWCLSCRKCSISVFNSLHAKVLRNHSLHCQTTYLFSLTSASSGPLYSAHCIVRGLPTPLTVLPWKGPWWLRTDSQLG